MKIKNDVSLSVILPTKNRLELLRFTIDSLLHQLKMGDEIIVSLNNVNDGTKEYLISLIPGDVKLTILETDGEMEIYQHWHFAIGRARNEHVVFVHDDEIYHSGLIVSVREEFESDSKVTLVTGGTVSIKLMRHPIAYVKNKFQKRRVFEGETWIKRQLERNKVVYGSTCYAFKRIPNAYEFLEKRTRVSDVLLMLTQATKGKVVEHDFFHGTHLLHKKNQSWIDYLTPEQTPYWLGLKRLAEESENVNILELALKEKSNAYALYIRNAVAAGVVSGDWKGVDTCLKLAQDLNPNGLQLKILKAVVARKLSRMLLRCMLKCVKSVASAVKQTLPEDHNHEVVRIQDISGNLRVDHEFVANWLDTANPLRQ